MPDSEEKPKRAKKAAKKAPAKKATKKAAAKTAPKKKAVREGRRGKTAQLSDAGVEALGQEPEPTGERFTDTDAVLDTLEGHIDKITKDADDAGAPLILGTCSVHLIMDFDDVVFPTEGVEKFIDLVNRHGLANLAFVVRDDLSRASYLVQRGQVVRLDEDEDAAVS